MLARLLRREESRDAALSWPDYLRLWEQFGFNGVQYVAPGGSIEEITAMQGASNPIVAACISVRLMVFSEARFLWQRWRDSRPGGFFGDRGLELIERPWPGGSTGHLLARMEVDASLYGNSYWLPQRGELVRLDPARMQIVMGEVEDLDSGRPIAQRLAGYAMVDDAGRNVAVFLPGDLVHYAPLPDPQTPFRGRSWLSPLLSDVAADGEMTTYKHAFLRNAATPHLAVKFEPGVSPDAAKEFKDKLESRHRGAANAFNTLYFGAGADVKTIGSNLEELAFKAVQGAGETRIASAAGVPAAILGISEGLAGSALNAGNYTATRRRFADGTVRPLWRSAAAALEVVLPSPGADTRLYYDDRDVSFLQEDVLDAAEINSRKASTIRQLIDTGFTPESAVEAVMHGDMERLEHTGFVSVQLRPPGETDDAA